MTEAGAAVSTILDACLRGEEPSLDTLRALEQRADLPEHLASAVHELHHFADDRDIRSQDAGYAAFWNRKLKALRLRVDAP